MHHAIEAGREEFFEGRAVGEVALDEIDAGGNHGAGGMAEIVVNQDGMALSCEDTGNHPPNVPSSASDQNSQDSQPPIHYANWVPVASEY